MLKKVLLSTLVAVGVMAAAPSSAADITLKISKLSNGTTNYYHRLLEESLKATGNAVKIEPMLDLPQPRIVAYLDDGQLTLHWMLQTKERDEKYVPVNHKLTQGLIGKRVMLVPKGDEGAYAQVKTLDDFKASGKVGGLGAGWFDVAVWKENGLPVVEQSGDWKQLYPMVASKSRGVDYFPRGASEIYDEVKANPTLGMESNLVLVYPRDFVFYLSKANASLKPVIEKALQEAEKSGLQKKLVDEYFGPSLATLNLDKRVQIKLADPKTK